MTSLQSATLTESSHKVDISHLTGGRKTSFLGMLARTDRFCGAGKCLRAQVGTAFTSRAWWCLKVVLFVCGPLNGLQSRGKWCAGSSISNRGLMPGALPGAMINNLDQNLLGAGTQPALGEVCCYNPHPR